MSKKVTIQLEIMVRYPGQGKKEIIEKFKGTKPTSLEMTLQRVIKEEIPTEYCPRRRFPFLFIYKIGSLQIAIVFFNGWRIYGKYDLDGNNILDLTKEDELFLQEAIKGGAS